MSAPRHSCDRGAGGLDEAELRHGLEEPGVPRERAGLYTFLELARDAGLLETVPELRFVQTTGAAVA